MNDFLQQVKNLPLSELSDQDLLKELDKLKSDVKLKHNSYIQGIIAG